MNEVSNETKCRPKGKRKHRTLGLSTITDFPTGSSLYTSGGDHGGRIWSEDREGWRMGVVLRQLPSFPLYNGPKWKIALILGDTQEQTRNPIDLSFGFTS